MTHKPWMHEGLKEWFIEVQSWLDKVAQERYRQIQKWGHQPDTSPWSDILMEEVGEVSKAKLEGKPEEMKTELVQVAAVAIAWAQALENGEA